MKFQLAHSGKNFVDIDDSSCDSCHDHEIESPDLSRFENNLDIEY